MRKKFFLFLLLFIGVFWFVFIKWWRHGRNPKIKKTVIAYYGGRNMSTSSFGEIGSSFSAFANSLSSTFQSSPGSSSGSGGAGGAG